MTIVPTRKMFRNYNRTKLAELAETSPIYKIDCVQTQKKKKTEELNDFGYMEETLYLCVGAKVVINKNLNAEKGIYNAA